MIALLVFSLFLFNAIELKFCFQGGSLDVHRPEAYATYSTPLVLGTAPLVRVSACCSALASDLKAASALW